MAINNVLVANYVDLPYGDVYLYGTTKQLQLKGIEAIKNVIKMYLFSMRGDYGRNTAKGGILFNMLGKQVTDSNASALKDRINTALQDFTNIVVQKIDVSLDTANKQFVVSITFIDNYNKFVNSLNFAVEGT